MSAFAQSEPAFSCYAIGEADPEGVGHTLVRVSYGNAPGSGMWTAELAARLLVIARNMDGGWERALEVLRADVVRQKADPA